MDGGSNEMAVWRLGGRGLEKVVEGEGEIIKSALLSIWRSNILKAIKCGEASVVSIDTIHCHNAKDARIHHTQKNCEIVRNCDTIKRTTRRFSPPKKNKKLLQEKVKYLISSMIHRLKRF